MGANVLLVCDQPKAAEFFQKFLQQNQYDVFTISNGEEAKRLCMDKSFETCIINAPLHGEKAEHLARALAQQNMFQVILFVKAEVEAETSVHMEKYGVITLGKPVHTKLFWDALRLSRIANNRIQMLMHENQKLQKKMKELKLVTQAKLILMQSLNISEEEAHRRIEKMAMNKRLSKKDVAQEIISTYE